MLSFRFGKEGEKIVSRAKDGIPSDLPMMNISEARTFISAFHVCVMMITLDHCVRLCIYVPRHHVITELHVYRVEITRYLYAAAQKSILGRDVMCSTHVIR